MVAVPEDARAAVAGAVFAEPRPHMPPRDDRIPAAAEMIDRKVCGLNDWSRTIVRDEEVTSRDDVTIGIVGAVLDELREFVGSPGTVAEAFGHGAGVEGAGAANERNGSAAAGSVGESHAPRPGMADESADEDQSFDSETRGAAGALLTLEKRPGDLGGERFAEDPASADAVLQQRGFHGSCVVAELPVRLVRVGSFDEARAVREGLAEGRKQGPIAVQSGQMGDCGRGSRAVNAKLELFERSDSGSVRRDLGRRV